MPIVVNWTEVLPAELVVKILSYLDFYSISQVRRVSKRCHAIIEIDPFILPSFLEKTRPYVKHLAKYLSHNDKFTGFPLDPAARVANLLEEKMKSVQRDIKFCDIYIYFRKTIMIYVMSSVHDWAKNSTLTPGLEYPWTKSVEDLSTLNEFCIELVENIVGKKLYKDIIEIIRSNKVRLTNIQQDLNRLVEEKATDHCALAMYKQSEVGSVVSDMCLGIHMEAEINILNLFARLNPILAQEFLN